MKISIELDFDQENEIVVKSLMWQYEYGDEKVCNAIEDVLEYYLTRSEFKEWKESVSEEK